MKFKLVTRFVLLIHFYCCAGKTTPNIFVLPRKKQSRGNKNWCDLAYIIRSRNKLSRQNIQRIHVRINNNFNLAQSKTGSQIVNLTIYESRRALANIYCLTIVVIIIYCFCIILSIVRLLFRNSNIAIVKKVFIWANKKSRIQGMTLKLNTWHTCGPDL